MTTTNNGSKKNANATVQKAVAQKEKQDSKGSKTGSTPQKNKTTTTTATTTTPPATASSANVVGVGNGSAGAATGATVLPPVQFFEVFSEYNFVSQDSDIADFDGKNEKTNGIFNHQISSADCSKLFIVSKTDDSKKLKAIKFDSNQLKTFVLDDGNQLKSDDQFIQVFTTWTQVSMAITRSSEYKNYRGKIFIHVLDFSRVHNETYFLRIVYKKYVPAYKNGKLNHDNEKETHNANENGIENEGTNNDGEEEEQQNNDQDPTHVDLEGDGQEKNGDGANALSKETTDIDKKSNNISDVAATDVVNNKHKLSGSTFSFQKTESASWADDDFHDDDENAVPPHRGRNAPTTSNDKKNSSGSDVNDQQQSDNDVTTASTNTKKKGTMAEFVKIIMAVGHEAVNTHFQRATTFKMVIDRTKGDNLSFNPNGRLLTFTTLFSFPILTGRQNKNTTDAKNNDDDTKQEQQQQPKRAQQNNQKKVEQQPQTKKSQNKKENDVNGDDNEEQKPKKRNNRQKRDPNAVDNRTPEQKARDEKANLNNPNNKNYKANDSKI